jgi:hypothetical protein
MNSGISRVRQTSAYLSWKKPGSDSAAGWSRRIPFVAIWSIERWAESRSLALAFRFLASLEKLR